MDSIREEVFLWCEQQTVAPTRCLGIYGDSQGVTDEEVLHVLHRIYGVEHPKILGWKGRDQHKTSLILCETQAELDKDFLPSLVSGPQKQQWHIVIPLKPKQLVAAPLNAELPDGDINRQVFPQAREENSQSPSSTRKTDEDQSELFLTVYRPGRRNVDADALSRLPGRFVESQEEEWIELPAPEVKGMCHEGRVVVPPVKECLTALGATTDALPRQYCWLSQMELSDLQKLSSSQVKEDQQNDSSIAAVRWSVKHRQRIHPSSLKTEEAILLSRQRESLVVKQGLLYRETSRKDGRERKQLVLPKKHRPMVLRALHDKHGHLGIEKTMSLISDRFYWPKMEIDIESYCKSCGTCILRKSLPEKAAPLKNISSNGPLELVCIDFLSVEPDESNKCNILVVTDHYTRYAQAYQTKDQRAVTVAKILWEKFFVHYGLPARIHSDQGRDFESKLIKELCEVCGIKKSRTTPFHPQGDPQPERFNRTLLSMMGTLDTKKKAHWSRHISHLVHAYNCTKNESTGYSPYLLMFGREARLPIDICFGMDTADPQEKPHLKYVEQLKQELMEAYRLAEAAASKAGQRNKGRYDLQVKEHILEPGDRVLLRHLGLPGKHKLANRWRKDPHVVVAKLPDIPAYRIRPEGLTGPIKTYHRQHLLPIRDGVRFWEEPETDEPNVSTPRRSRRIREPTTEEDDGDDWGYDAPGKLGEIDWRQDIRRLTRSTEGAAVRPPQVEERRTMPAISDESVNPRVAGRLDSQCSVEEGSNQEVDMDGDVVDPDGGCTERPNRVLGGEEGNPPVQGRPKRTPRAPMMLTYDSLGHMTEIPKVIHPSWVYQWPYLTPISVMPGHVVYGCGSVFRQDVLTPLNLQDVGQASSFVHCGLAPQGECVTPGDAAVGLEHPGANNHNCISKKRDAYSYLPVKEKELHLPETCYEEGAEPKETELCDQFR
ncbi:uncharacterized protein LOC142097511 [Mixophyes fleayi]|uniref:uncharacterized protein LOC142097511 n=1 Tax=Mixophyes fleayi TaxID=3061075 RepID=UPI003F4E1E45